MSGRYTPPKRRRDPVAGLYPHSVVALTGIPLRIDSGCDECDAFTDIEQVKRGAWQHLVQHDLDCPRLARIKTKVEELRAADGSEAGR